jgi:phage tail tape-measure protein
MASQVQTGAATGAAVGSIVPGVGTAVGGAIGSIAGIGISLFGGGISRSAKRRRRDQALKTLYSLGMRQNIFLKNSDNFDVVEYLV